MAPNDSPVIEARGVVHRYGERRALDGFDLEVPPASVFGLLGPNGSGKSTFVALVAAMERPSQGSLTVFGREPSAPLRARVGTVFQENAQDPLMSVDETVWLAGRLFGVPRAALRDRARALLAAFGLGERRGDAVSTLSGGMRRRLEMARALVHDPELVLLDEPTTGVDPGERRALWDAVLGERRRTILVATNDLAEADSVCDHVAFIKDGRVLAAGKPADLKRGLRREAVRLTWHEPTEEQLREVGRWPGTGGVTCDGQTVHITADDASALVPRLFELAPGAIRSVTIEASSLEDAYFQFVSRQEPLATVAAT